MLTAERLREMLDYDPETGVFRWRITIKRSSVFPGKVAGCPSTKGYHQIKIDRRAYEAHRLAWLYVHGQWPVRMIDHKNRERSDNRISNLRVADDSQNAVNQHRRLGKSGVKGAVAVGDRWQAQIKVRGRNIYLGLFATPEEAGAAYREAAQHHFGEFAA